MTYKYLQYMAQNIQLRIFKLDWFFFLLNDGSHGQILWEGREGGRHLICLCVSVCLICCESIGITVLSAPMTTGTILPFTFHMLFHSSFMLWYFSRFSYSSFLMLCLCTITSITSSVFSSLSFPMISSWLIKLAFLSGSGSPTGS